MSVPAAPKRYGIVYGFRALGDWGLLSGGYGTVYYFGRTKQKCMLELKVEDGANSFDAGRLELLKKKCKCVGLNTPSRVLLWACVSDIDYCWDELRRELVGGWNGTQRLEIEGRDDLQAPEVTQYLLLGDNWFGVSNMGPEYFGAWCSAFAEKHFGTFLMQPGFC